LLAGVGAEDGRGLVGIAGDLDPRGVVGRQLDHRIRLVVLESDVVPGLVALDQVRLEQQRLRLGVGDGDLDLAGAVDHPADPRAAGIGVGPDPARLRRSTAFPT